MDATRPRRRLPVPARIALAWAPFAVLWALFSIISFGTAPVAALLSGASTMGAAAVLSVAVWQVTRVLPWPAHVRAGFYLAHVAASLGFAVAWLLLGALFSAVAFGESVGGVLEMLRPFLVWRMLTGVWLYGLIAGVGYVLQIQGALFRQEQAAARAEALAAEAQLESLRARLNPHFFFNALHALSGLIHRDPDLADDALDRIGQLMRRSLAGDARRLVPLAEEWDFTADYLELERLRLGERLRVDAAIDDSAGDCLVPSFTLQPMVENAVLHAVAPAAEGATIILRAARADGRLTISVSDDGRGTAPVPRERQGHGLELLRRRLAVIYGDRASLAAGPAEAGGWRAVVELPVEEA